MNKTFSFERFCKYFTYDIKQAYNKFGISALILGLTPLVIFLFFIFFKYISGVLAGEDVMDSFNGVHKIGVIALVMEYLILMISSPSKIYGDLTDRRAGSNFKLIPASVFEKWLSMILVVGIVVPLATLTVTIITDSALGLLFKNMYHGIILTAIPEFLERFSQEVENNISIAFGGLTFWSWLINVLAFTLGAICFKRAKPAKTILVMMIAGSVLSSILLPVMLSENVQDSISMMFNGIGIRSFFNLVNISINLIYALELAIVGGGLYYRLRTLSH